MTYDDGHSVTFCTRNISATGLFLDKGNNELPEVGSLIQIQVSADQGIQDAPLVKAEVSHKTDEGVGIIFLTP